MDYTLNRLRLLGLCLTALAASPSLRAGAPPAPVPPAADGQRFLFVVDMSSAMEEMQTAVEATVYDLIRSGLGAQMRAGDSFGLWTFNKEVYTGKFSVTVWDPKRSTQQGALAASFLSGKTYEKRSDLKKVMATVSRIVSAVSDLT